MSADPKASGTQDQSDLDLTEGRHSLASEDEETNLHDPFNARTESEDVRFNENVHLGGETPVDQGDAVTREDGTRATDTGPAGQDDPGAPGPAAGPIEAMSGQATDGVTPGEADRDGGQGGDAPAQTDPQIETAGESQSRGALRAESVTPGEAQPFASMTVPPVPQAVPAEEESSDSVSGLADRQDDSLIGTTSTAATDPAAPPPAPVEPVISLSAADGAETASVTEGDGTQGRPVAFKVSLDQSTTQDVWVNFTTRDGSANSQWVSDGQGGWTAPEGTDYDYYAQTDSWVLIPAGETEATFDVYTRADDGDEADETFSVHLKGSSAERGGAEAFGTIDADHASVEATILDNDEPPPDPDVVFTLDNSGTSNPDYAGDDVVTVTQSDDDVANPWGADVSADTLLADSDDDGASISVDRWNSAKSVRAEGEAGADVTIDNFVRADVDLSEGTGDSTVTIDGAKRGSVETADGDDVVDIDALTNGSGWDNTFTVDTGAGDDTITATGDGGHTRFDIKTGEGADTVTVDGQSESATVVTEDAATIDVSGADSVDITTGESYETRTNSRGYEYKVHDDNSVTVDDADETSVHTGRGDDTISVGASGEGADTVFVDSGHGRDTINVTGEGGETHITVDGGYGRDTVTLDGDYGSSEVHLDGGTAWTRSDGTAVRRDNLTEDQTTGAHDDTFEGGVGDDLVTGGGGDDVLDGGDGANQLFGNSGDDTLTGGRDDDLLDGGTGDDRLMGRHGDDTLSGGEGDDYLHGNSADDTLDGGAGDDTLYGGLDTDTLRGGDGDDTLYGENNWSDDKYQGRDDRMGADTLEGGAGNDKLYGEWGDDTLTGGTGDDRVSGGKGTDTAIFSGPVEDYEITVNDDGTITVADSIVGRDGTDILDGIENIQFSDGTLDQDGLSALLEARAAPPDLTGTSVTIDTTNYDSTNQGFAVKAINIDADGNQTEALTENVSRTKHGLGANGNNASGPSAQIGYDADGGQGEALVIELDAPASSATASFTRAFANEGGGEQVSWEIYKDGEKVGEGTKTADSGHSGEVTIESDGVVFDEIRFVGDTYADDSVARNGDASDFMIQSVDVTFADAEALAAAADPGPTLTGVADAVRVTNVNDFSYAHSLDGSPDFPDLSENTRLDPEKVNGVSPDSLTLAHDHDVSVTFVSEGAGYHNSLGWYTIDQETGAIDNVQFVYGDATDKVIEKAGTETVTLTPPEGGFEGKTLGFFLVPNGHNKNKNEDFWDDASKNEGGKLSFVDENGDPATTATETPRLVFTDDNGDVHEIDSQGGIYHSAAAGDETLALNPDNLQHAISGVTPDGENLMVGFEDLKGGGDSDYNDLVFTVNVGAENAREMVPTTVAPKLDVDAGASGTITGATVAITEGLKAGDELLVNGLQVSESGEIGDTGITLTRVEGENGGTVLQFSGEADADTYSDLLGRVTLKSSSDSPETGERTITFEVEDGSGKSVSESATVNVTDGTEEPSAAADELSIMRGAARVGPQSETPVDDAITGTDDRDVLNGTQDDDTIFGAGGDDKIIGHQGDDHLSGGEGNDELFGQQGDDTLIGGAGDDTLSGGLDGDVLDGGSGKDVVDGGKGDDTGVVFLEDRDGGGTARYDGGDGTDTLRVVVDDASMGDADRMDALWDLDQAIANGNGDGTFDALGLEVNDWESMELVNSDGDALDWVEGSERALEVRHDIASLDDLHSPATPNEDPAEAFGQAEDPGQGGEQDALNGAFVDESLNAS